MLHYEGVFKTGSSIVILEVPSSIQVTIHWTKKSFSRGSEGITPILGEFVVS